MNKKIFVLMFCVILLAAPLISASLEWDNVIHYEDKDGVKDKVVYFENAFGWPLIGDTIAKAELITPMENYVIRGKNRRVMIIEVENYWEDYDKGLKAFEIFNMKTSGLENKDYHLEYAIYGDVVVNDVKETCEDMYLSATDKIENVCRNEVIGTHIESQIIEWKVLEGDIIPKGNTTIALVTDVGAGDYYDGIPDLFGLKVREWAVWTESLSVGIMHYWNLNEIKDVTTNKTINQINASANGTIVNGDYNKPLGKIGRGLFIDDNPYINTSILTLYNYGGTFSIWLNSSVDVGEDMYMFDHAGPARTYLNQEATLGSTMNLFNVGVVQLSVNTTKAHNWTFAVITWNRTAWNYYMNGSFVETFNNKVSTKNNTRALRIGAKVPGTGFKGVMDEIGIWNRTLSSTEITQLWNNGSGIINNDSINPSIIIDVAQPTFSGLQSVPYDISINYSVADQQLQRCWYNSTWNLTTTYLTCNQNLTNITMPVYGLNHTIFIYANDSWGNENVTSKSIPIDAVEIARSYASITTEGTFSTFQINITIPVTRILSSKNLIYNNTDFGSGISVNFEGNNYSITKSILVPNVDTKANITFFWNITLDDDTQIASIRRNQTVNNFAVDNCTTGSIAFANFTVVDEEVQNTLLANNVTVEIAVNIFSADRTVNIANFSELFNSTNPVSLCLSSNVTGEAAYSLDLIARYEAKDHANEYYNLNRFILDGDFQFQNVFLYDLLSADSTDFQITFKGSDFVAVEDALINLKRQYIEENLFKTVELPLTDSNGQTILHLVRNEVVYTIEVIKDNEVLGTFSNIIAFCDDFSIGDCKINLNAFSSSENLFSYDDDLGIMFTEPTFNNNTRVVSFDFTTSDGSIKEVNLAVTRNDIFGNTSVCNYSLSSSSGTLLCTVPGYIDDSILNIEVTVDGELAIKDNVTLESTGYGYFGYFIFFIYVLAFVFMFAGSKSVMLIGLVISFLSAIALGLIQGKIIGLAASGIWLILIVVLIIWKLNKDRED